MRGSRWWRHRGMAAISNHAALRFATAKSTGSVCKPRWIQPTYESTKAPLPNLKSYRITVMAGDVLGFASILLLLF